MRYLLDASALYDLFASGKAMPINATAILPLTVYEIGNILWKDHRAGKIRNMDIVTVAFGEFFNNIGRLEPDFEHAENIALSRGISFYDASYISAAEAGNLLLVTQDKEILKKSKSAISVKEFLKDEASE